MWWILFASHFKYTPVLGQLKCAFSSKLISAVLINHDACIKNELQGYFKNPFFLFVRYQQGGEIYTAIKIIIEVPNIFIHSFRSSRLLFSLPDNSKPLREGWKNYYRSKRQKSVWELDSLVSQLGTRPGLAQLSSAQLLAAAAAFRGADVLLVTPPTCSPCDGESCQTDRQPPAWTDSHQPNPTHGDQRAMEPRTFNLTSGFLVREAGKVKHFRL